LHKQGEKTQKIIDSFGLDKVTYLSDHKSAQRAKESDGSGTNVNS
jgi:NADH/NAD ratio-sensing transcriptional regulator Rex